MAILDRPKLFKSFVYALRGIGYTFKTQQNMRLHLLAAFLVVFFAWFLGVARADLALLVFAITLVLACELINTAVEAAVDLFIGEDRHPLAALAKDAAAGAVLVAAVGAAAVGVLVFGPYLLGALGR